MPNSNVLYYEPNYNYHMPNPNGVNMFNIVQTAPPLEDYCIVVDLEVEIPARPLYGEVKTNNKVIILRYMSSMNGNSRVSFNQGKKYPGSDNFYLTTEPFDKGTFNDIKRDEISSSEMFGINSINIEYKTYAVPVITIEFTDIRGLSLFGHEDLRHNVESVDGISYSANSDIAGSFFKCFFLAPRPRFRIMVKGFYGNPVSYELVCSDFRANFNSSTGNFGATAKFVGFTFSVLNDLTMASLIASPYSEYFGKKYWQNNAHKFVFEDGKPMIPLYELMSRIKASNNLLTKEDNSQEQKEEEQIQILYQVSDLHQQYFNKLVEYVKSINQEQNYIIDTSTMRIATIAMLNKKQIDDLEKYYQQLANIAKQNSMGDKLPAKYGLYTKISYKDLKNAQFYNINIDNAKAKAFAEKKEFYNYDGSAFQSFISNKQKKHKDNIVKIKHQKDEVKNQKIEQLLGFKPSVKNITELILAHVETFIHEVYACASNVSKLPRGSKLPYRNDMRKSDNEFYAFPLVTEKIDDASHITKEEKTWIGKVEPSAPEAQLVESLLQATSTTSKSLAVNASSSFTSTTPSLNINVQVPVLPFDFIGNSTPYYNVNLDSYDDLCGKILIRALLANSSIINKNKTIKAINDVGYGDALNFYYNNTAISESFKEKILSSNVLSNENIINLLLDSTRSTVLSNKNKSLWYTINHQRNELLTYKANGSECECLFFTNNTNNYDILPISEFEWESFPINLNNANSNFFDQKSYYTYGLNKQNDNLFKIETDWKKYHTYTNDYFTSKLETLGNLYTLKVSSKEMKKWYNLILKSASFLSKKNSVAYNNITFTHDNFPLVLPESNSVKISKKNINLEKSSEDDIIYIDNNSKKYSISSIGDSEISDIFDNLNNTNNYTINYFCGYNQNTTTSTVSVFGQGRYYDIFQQNGINAAALYFLNTFSWNYNLLVDVLKDKNLNYIPCLAAITIGGYFYKFDNKKEFVNCIELNQYTFYQTFINIKNEIKEAFKTLFTEWVKNSFIQIHNGYALHLKSNSSYNNVQEFIMNFVQKYRVGNNNTYVRDAILELRTNLTEAFFQNYSMVQLDVSSEKYGLKLCNREGTEILDSIVQTLLSPCLLINSYKNPLQTTKNTDRTTVISMKGIDAYLKGFIQGLKDNIPQQQEELQTTTITTSKTDEQIKIALYNYLKIIWDKWLSGSPLINGESIWDLSKLKNNWHYIDSFYNKLPDKALINVWDLGQDLIDSFRSIGVSALSVMSSSYARSRFNLVCVQNFASLIDDNLMKDMFNVVPYNKIDSSMVKKVSDFVVIYLNEPSSKLNINSSKFSDDTFLIGGDDKQLPIPILTKNNENGYKIPAFGVTYGGQYQSYFSDIQVNMESPQVTDQSLQAEFAIVKGNDTNSVSMIGQDLFTIYANQSFTCTVTMLGCAWVQPLMYFQLNNIPMFSGSYIIHNVSHSITPGNMITKFTGVRMSKNSIPFVDNGILFNLDLDQRNNSLVSNVDESKHADIYNNCPYKYFSPLNEYSENGMSESELDMLVGTYGKRHSGWKFNLPNDKLNKTMAEFFADIVYGETSDADDLSAQLILTVLFNRYKACKSDFCLVLKNKKQHEIGRTCPDKIKDRYVQLAKKIFINTPLYLVGEQTYVKKSIPIWNYNTKTNSDTISKALTEHDVKSMDAYCSTRGYDTDYVRTSTDRLEARPPAANAYWHRGEYLAQHDIIKGNFYGHVFVSVGFENNKPGTEHWQPKITTKNYHNDKDLAKKLMDSIKKTIQYSDRININCDNLSMEFVNSQNNVIKITSKNQSDLAQVFDIINNTYYDHFAELHWVVNNSGNELPQYLQVKISNNSLNKIIAISQLANSNQIKVLPQYKDLNELFYLSLQKKYGDLTTTKQQFKLECLNFLSLTKNENWETEVKKYFNLQLQNCIQVSNGYLDGNYVAQGFSWKGRDNKQNKLSPVSIKPTDPNAMNKAVAYIMKRAYDKYDKNLCGHCAKAVREALMNSQGGNLPLKNWPYSACCYIEHLPYWGFKRVYSGEAYAPINGYVPKNGDIVVIAGYNAQRDGHIQIYSESTNMWYSDYKEKDIWCYNSPKGRPYVVFRYNP